MSKTTDYVIKIMNEEREEGPVNPKDLADPNKTNAFFVSKQGRCDYGNFSTDASVRRHAKKIDAQRAFRYEPSLDKYFQIYRCVEEDE